LIPKRGVHKITNVDSNPEEKRERIDVDYLGQFQEFKDFRALRHIKEEAEGTGLDINNQTPRNGLRAAPETTWRSSPSFCRD